MIASLALFRQVVRDLIVTEEKGVPMIPVVIAHVKGMEAPLLMTRMNQIAIVTVGIETHPGAT